VEKSSSKITITGGTGFLGTSLAEFFIEKGWEVVVVSRKKMEPSKQLEGATYLKWDGRTAEGWGACLEGSRAVINLAGRSVDCIKTPDNCDEILRSRVESVHAVAKAIRLLEHPPECWIQMSTAHCYGDPPATVCSEDSPFGYGLAPFVAKAWEEAHRLNCPATVRSVVLRTSFVLGHGGGALSKMSRLAKLGLGGRVGSGRQGVSWIHGKDMNRLIFEAAENRSMKGHYLATSPNPVTNTIFMRELRRAVGMPFGLPAPEFAVRVAAPFLMKTDPELAIYGRYCVSERLASEGFEFEFADLRDALQDIFQKDR
jgi:uncharacterized protein (TIGR01777 family)